ncbi:unnamed protein product [Cuscuta campestris]|uniref:Transposase-associated domain-containing protein n=1 Tax=Cuscuta campestris TaxID=132261 RepID=A0A484KMR2_9ASTE|nr:unnamed protein product [Cuscuta campestris]
MNNDRSWMNWETYSCRTKPEYINGVKDFLDFAFAHASKEGKIRCPCINCDNYNHQNRKTVLFHLLNDGIVRSYNPWDFHGEKSTHEENCNNSGVETTEGNNLNSKQPTIEDANETYAMLHDMTYTRAFNIVNELERLSDPEISESTELLEKFEMDPLPKPLSGDDVLDQIGDRENFMFAQPEGSIAEAYIADECLTFCSRYLHRAETRFNRLERNEDGGKTQHQVISVFSKFGKTIGHGVVKSLSFEDWERAHLYVLRNCEEVHPFTEEYESKNPHPSRSSSFPEWFESRITQLWNQHDKKGSYDLLVLAQRVMVKGDVHSGGKDFYGVLNEVVELEYDSKHKVVLFKCEWYDVFAENLGIKADTFGINSVNISRYLKTNEPYVLASQVQQVYYVNDHAHRNWRVVLKTNPHSFYDVPEEDEEDTFFIEPSVDTEDAYIPTDSQRITSLVRDDVDAIVVDANAMTQQKQRHHKKQKIVGPNDESGSSSSSTLFHVFACVLV